MDLHSVTHSYKHRSVVASVLALGSHRRSPAMKLKLLYRGDQHQMDISSDARLADLRQEIFARTSVPPENQKLLPKPAKGISGLAACSDDQTRCLDDCGIRDGLAIMVVGATVAEVDQIQHREKEESRWKQPRNYHPSMLKGTKVSGGRLFCYRAHLLISYALIAGTHDR